MRAPGDRYQEVKAILTQGGALRHHHLPRYQWTACDGRTRLRFLAFRHTLNRTHGLAFLILVLRWLRAFGVETPVTFQTDGDRSSGVTIPAT